MATIGLECHGVFIGAMDFPDRKKPCLVVERGNEIAIIGTFNNVNCVEFFGDAIKQLLGREEHGRWEVN